jgi:hypothetical protein
MLCFVTVPSIFEHFGCIAENRWSIPDILIIGSLAGNDQSLIHQILQIINRPCESF